MLAGELHTFGRVLKTAVCHGEKQFRFEKEITKTGCVDTNIAPVK